MPGGLPPLLPPLTVTEATVTVELVNNAGSELTIDELAQRLGMTTRNIREYQALGLLPPPRKRGRSGYYGLDHIARAGRIRELRSDGFPLELIRRVLDAEGDDQLVSSAHALREPFQDEAPEVVDAEE